LAGCEATIQQVGCNVELVIAVRCGFVFAKKLSTLSRATALRFRVLPSTLLCRLRCKQMMFYQNKGSKKQSRHDAKNGCK
jgi:hypothetical protein